ncbi:MAG: hypothetical protein IPO01_17230 [Chitinophagaceae bacterium]|nr:hypothetical protein [Chitinophagaceae bacterium]MBK9486853.1 hypothetical protein [Chitinophagaceae bacterium]MBL0202587.1 hypothetical protein [Chitinophagaceae bacterium]
MQAYMTTFVNIVILSFLLMTTYSCHDNKIDSGSASYSDSTNTIPGLISPGSISTYSIFELDTAIKPVKVSLYQLDKDYKSLHGKFIETEGKFKYRYEKISISSNPAFDNCEVFFWLDINNSNLPFQQGFDKMSGKHIRIKGMVDTTHQGHLNSYPAAITKIYFWEVKN